MHKCDYKLRLRNWFCIWYAKVIGTSQGNVPMTSQTNVPWTSPKCYEDVQWTSWGRHFVRWVSCLIYLLPKRHLGLTVQHQMRYNEYKHSMLWSTIVIILNLFGEAWPQVELQCPTIVAVARTPPSNEKSPLRIRQMISQRLRISPKLMLLIAQW